MFLYVFLYLLVSSCVFLCAKRKRGLNSIVLDNSLAKHLKSCRPKGGRSATAFGSTEEYTPTVKKRKKNFGPNFIMCYICGRKFGTNPNPNPNPNPDKLTLIFYRIFYFFIFFIYFSGSLSLPIHQEQCKELWIAREAKKPKRKRKPLPKPPDEREAPVDEYTVYFFILFFIFYNLLLLFIFFFNLFYQFFLFCFVLFCLIV